MSGKVIHAGTAIGCPHGGRVSAGPAAGTGVLVDGLPAATGTLVHTVTGCRHTVDGVPAPCTTVRWAPPSGGVLADGSPLLLESTPGVCFTAGLVPQGQPVVAPAAQEGVTCG
ncbi:hypothetical protein GCM10010420_53560 [Streptomyces glaucosporus]|uniref:Uncharacterized protein n=1 Tax=Streptomyces glaucosporus TaxID=284044 RepID=A0ABN3IZ05_9ACTN